MWAGARVCCVCDRRKRVGGRLSVARGGRGAVPTSLPSTSPTSRPSSFSLLFRPATPARRPPATPRLGRRPLPRRRHRPPPPPAPARWPRWRRSSARRRRRRRRSRAVRRRHHHPATARHPTATGRHRQAMVSMVCRRRLLPGRTRPTRCPRTRSRRRSGWRRRRRRGRGLPWARRARHARRSRLHRLPAGGTASRRWRRLGWGWRRRRSRSRARPRSRRLHPPSPCPLCARVGGRMCLVRLPGAI